MSAVIIEATVEAILSALGSAASAGLLGGKVAAFAPVFGTLEQLATLPDQFATERSALLAQVQGWVASGVGPTDAELDAFKSTRDSLFDQAQKALAALG